MRLFLKGGDLILDLFGGSSQGAYESNDLASHACYNFSIVLSILRYSVIQPSYLGAEGTHLDSIDDGLHNGNNRGNRWYGYE